MSGFNQVKIHNVMTCFLMPQGVSLDLFTHIKRHRAFYRLYRVNIKLLPEIFHKIAPIVIIRMIKRILFYIFATPGLHQKYNCLFINNYMTTDSIITSVKEVYRALDEHLGLIALKTGLKCPKNCSACCYKRDIDASPIEYYPLAEWLYQSGQVDEYLEKLEENKEKGYCVLYSPEAGTRGEGSCRQYDYRGLTCRLFGFGYRLNKENIPDLVTCKIMKTNLPLAILEANRLGIKNSDEMPIFSNYFMQLYSIDPDLAIKRLPINKAIRMAIENLYFHCSGYIE
jgi:uncharacterized protein